MMVQIGKSLEREAWFLGRAFIVFLFLLAAFVSAPAIERALWPVSGNFQLTDAVRQPDGTIRFRFSFDRYRQNCAVRAPVWYEIVNGVYGRPGVVRMDNDPTLNDRPPGPNLSSWWIAPGPGTYERQISYDCGMPWGDSGPARSRFTLP